MLHTATWLRPDHRRQGWSLLVWGSVGQILALVPPYLPKLAIDEAIATGRTHVLWIIAAAGIAVHGFASLVTYRTRVRTARLAEELWLDLRDRCLSHLQGLSLSFHRSHPTGELLSRVHYDTWSLKSLVVVGIPGFASLIVGVGGTAVVLLILAPQLVLLALLPLPLMAVLIWWFRRRIQPLSLRSMEDLAGLQAALVEGLDGVESIKAYEAEKLVADRVHDAGRRLAETEVELARRTAVLGPALDLGIAIVLLGSLAVGGTMVIEGAVSLGTLVAFYFYVARTLGPVRGAAGVVSTWQNALVASERLGQIFEAEETLPRHSQPRALPEGPLALSFEGVSFAYQDQDVGSRFVALDDVTLTIAPGSRIAILGPSGSGKSTTGKLIPRLFDPEAGRLCLGGVDLRELDVSEVRRRVGYVGQEVFLLRGTIEDNVRFAALTATCEAVEKALSLSGADRIVVAKEAGLATLVGERGVHLSGGEKKRIALARALLRSPQILVIDQLASDLEVDLCQSIFTALETLPDLSVLYLGHRVPAGLEPHATFWMEHGRIRPTDG